MIVVPFTAAHMRELDQADGRAYLAMSVTPAQIEAMEADTRTYTGLHEGNVVAIGGIADAWVGRALLWSYMGPTARRHMVALTRVAKRLIEMSPVNRLEADVDVDFEPGHRWLQLLGFELETPRMRKYRPDGGDMAKYVRII